MIVVKSKNINKYIDLDIDFFVADSQLQLTVVFACYALFFLSLSHLLTLSHAVQKKFFAFGWGLCLGKCPAKMLSWKLRILTPTTFFTLLLSGCSHRRKRQAYAGLIPQPCLSLSLSPCFLFSPRFPPSLSPSLSLTNNPSPAISLFFFSLTRLGAVWLQYTSPWMAISCEPVDQLQLSSYSKYMKPSLSHLINNK